MKSRSAKSVRCIPSIRREQLEAVVVSQRRQLTQASSPQRCECPHMLLDGDTLATRPHSVQ
jgi:hypothetical protein